MAFEIERMPKRILGMKEADYSAVLRKDGMVILVQIDFHATQEQADQFVKEMAGIT